MMKTLFETIDSIVMPITFILVAHFVVLYVIIPLIIWL